MNSFWVIWDVLFCMAESMLIIYLFNNQLQVKSKTCIYIGAAGIFLVLVIGTFFLSNFYLRLIMNFVAGLLFALFSFRNSISIKIIFSFIPLLISNLSEGIALSLLAIFETDMEALMQPSVVRFQFMAFTMMINFALYYIAANINKGLFKKDIIHFPKRVKLFIFILLLLACYAMQNVYDLSIWFNQNASDSPLLADTIIISISIMIFAVSFLVLVIWLGALNKKNIEQVLDADRVKNQLEVIRDAEALAEALSLQRHEFRGHLDVMRALIYNKKYDELVHYFNEYADQLDTDTLHPWTANPSLNACLSVKHRRAIKYGITLTVQYNVYRDLPLETTDMCSLAGNMLDNAIEACIKVKEERYINFIMVERKDTIIISVENSANNVINITEGQSDKAGEHGLGIRQMNRLVKKADGYLDIHALGDKVIVSAVFPVEDKMNARIS